MKKRILKSLSLCLALVLIAGVLLCAVALLGNPISMILAYSTAKAHIESNYADADYEIEKIIYDAKFSGNYYVYASSPSRIDGDFTIVIDSFGKLKEDDYLSNVEKHINVARRLNDEYGERVMVVTGSSLFPYTVAASYGSLNFFNYSFDAPGKISSADLVNDKIYDVGELGKTNGTLFLYIDSDEVTYEMAAEILLKTKGLMEEAGISFYSVDLSLRHPPYDPERTSERPAGEIRLYSFLCTDIYEDGIVERIKEHDKKDEF